jgi:hypothetical protein
MVHIPKNSMMPLIVDAAVYDGLVRLEDEEANLYTNIFCLENGYVLDSGTMQFTATPVSPNFPVTQWESFKHMYYTRLQTNTWRRGQYRGLIRHTSGQEYALDFSIGLFTNRKLAHSMAYTGTNLKVSLWIEENGELQLDYVQLKDITIVDMSGTLIGTLPDNSSPSNGIFSWDQAITLTANRHFILKATAVVPGPVGMANYSFPVALGVVRP